MHVKLSMGNLSNDLLSFDLKNEESLHHSRDLTKLSYIWDNHWEFLIQSKITVNNNDM